MPPQQPNQPQQPDPFQPSAPQGSPAGQPSVTASGPPPQAASQQKHSKPLVFIIVIVLLSLALIASLIWAFMLMGSRNDFRDNTQSKVDEAVSSAVETRETELEAEFIEREKEPLINYTGPSEFGTISIDFPKTWAAHVDESKSGKTPVDGYFHPKFVPGTDSGVSFALRVEVIESPYGKELDDYAKAAEKQEVTVAPFVLDKVPSVAGSRIDGEVEKGKQGSVVLFPLRDKTIRISTLSDTFIKDFDSIILKNMSFQP
jgi:hypothetical protein